MAFIIQVFRENRATNALGSPLLRSRRRIRKLAGPEEDLGIWQLSPPTLPVRDPFFTSESSQPGKNRLVSSGNGANTRQYYPLKLLFCQNIDFKSNKTVQYRSVLRAPFFTNLVVRLSRKTPANRSIRPSK